MCINRKNKYLEKEKKKILYKKISNEKISEVIIANTFQKRLLGLMFRQKTEFPMLFEIPQNIGSRMRSSIHSLFMRFDLKLVFIDKNNIVFEMADLKPWRLYVPKKEAKYIIECDKSKFENYNIKIGDKIEIR